MIAKTNGNTTEGMKVDMGMLEGRRAIGHYTVTSSTPDLEGVASDE